MPLILLLSHLLPLHSRDPIDFLFDQVGRQQLKSFAEHHPSKRIPADGLSSLRLTLVADDTPPVVQPSASYDGVGCAAASSAAVRSCQIFAEQTCYDPFLPDAVALTIQSTRMQQLGGADFQVHATSVCRRRLCEEAACDNPAEPGEHERCLPCLRTCNAACLMNVELACLRKVCASSIGVAAASAVAGHSETTSLVQTTEMATRKALLGRWLRSFLVASDSGDSSAPVCTDAALKASDTAVIGPGGLTYTSALVGCVENYFTVDKVKRTVTDPARATSDVMCALVDKCPRDNAKLASVRADKMWSDLAAKYKL